MCFFSYIEIDKYIATVGFTSVHAAHGGGIVSSGEVTYGYTFVPSLCYTYIMYLPCEKKV